MGLLGQTAPLTWAACSDRVPAWAQLKVSSGSFGTAGKGGAGLVVAWLPVPIAMWARCLFWCAHSSPAALMGRTLRSGLAIWWWCGLQLQLLLVKQCLTLVYLPKPSACSYEGPNCDVDVNESVGEAGCSAWPCA